MRRGEHLPDDQAEVVFSAEMIEQLVSDFTETDRFRIFDEIAGLFAQPWGKHPLSNREGGDRLAGFNTVEVLDRKYRIVFRATVTPESVGLIEILAIGPRSENRIYDAIGAMLSTGRLDDVRDQVWDVLSIFEDTAERLGLERWEYAPEEPPEGLVRAAVASGVLPIELAELLSTDELNIAMNEGWGSDGEPDSAGAVSAALSRVAGSSEPDRILSARQEPRCGVEMPRAKKPCIRKAGHPGAHRSTA